MSGVDVRRQREAGQRRSGKHGSKSLLAPSCTEACLSKVS